MAVSVTNSSLFSAQALAGRGKKPFRHVTDSERIRQLAAKQQITGINSPHKLHQGEGPPTKRTKK